VGFTTRLRALGFAAIAAGSILTVAAPTVAAAGPTTVRSTAAVRVVRIAEAQRGKRYAYGAIGPSAFDCSGLVRFSYAQAGVNSRLGGGHSGTAMLSWARAHHLFSKSNPQVGDVVVYGGGAHVGIYIGNGKVVSALNPSQGIRITGLHALRQAVTGYIHTHLGKRVSPVIGPVRKPAAKVVIAGVTVRTAVYANLRSSASTAGRVLAVVRPGVKLKVVASTMTHAKRWDRVIYAGHAYWIRADLVRAV
jgi:peptidoglycan DL-endopeptidase CwlO